MKLFDLFTEAELNSQIEAKMVKATPHPTGDLTIYNYTQQATFTPDLWNHVTDKCRGLIVDREGNIVSRPFEKFWNYGDARHPETMPENIPAALPLLTRKMDGSLGILYRLHGKTCIATRGSFTSDQAIWASEWINQRRNDFQCGFYYPEGYTPVFEIIYPENQIVVRYDYSGLVLLAFINIETGEELSYSSFTTWGKANNIRVVEQFDKPLAECVAEDIKNEEGYVASWPRSGTTPLRVKIKYNTYCTLHRLLTQTNAVTVWEMLRDGLDIASLTKDVPQEFSDWINGIQSNLREQFTDIERRSLNALYDYEGEKRIEDRAAKKQFAMYVLKEHKDIAPILFSMIDRKEYAPIIWKMIRPDGSRPFKIDTDV